MTDKQKAFVTEYLKDFNATRAAIAAGYSEDTARNIGHENLTKPDIKKLIDEEKARLVSNGDAIVSANIKYWLSVRDDPEASHTHRLKASEYLGRYGVMFTEKVEHSGNLALSKVTDKDLDKKIAELTVKLKG
jgi:phage terminase small subunit